MLSFLESCHVARYFYWNTAGINDYRKFPSVSIKSGEKEFIIPFDSDPLIPELPAEFNIEGQYHDLDDFLKKNKTAALLMVRKGKIIYEKYYDDYDANSIFPSFSVSKSIISALIGIAIDEDKIEGVDQVITEFFPELDQSSFGNITIRNLLNMRSGLKFAEGYYNPFSEMARFYYGRNLKKYTLKSKIAGPPGEYYEYMSVNTQLLTFILERSVGMKASEYLEEKIWKPAGMEHDATWNIDSKKHQNIKGFCCINARIHDFARFGMLYLNHGYLNGTQVVPEEWVRQSIRITNDSRDSQGYPYHYGWRVKNDGAFFAKGILGQYIYVDPNTEIVIVRIGKKEKKVVWVDFFEKICSQYQSLPKK